MAEFLAKSFRHGPPARSQTRKLLKVLEILQEFSDFRTEIHIATEIPLSIAILP